ncbi:hypothetical protein [Streptomyces sp. NPDC003032]
MRSVTVKVTARWPDLPFLVTTVLRVILTGKLSSLTLCGLLGHGGGGGGTAGGGVGKGGAGGGRDGEGGDSGYGYGYGYGCGADAHGCSLLV